MKKLLIYSALTLSTLVSTPLLADGGAANFSGVTSSNTSLLLDTSLGDAASEIMTTTLKVPGEKKSLLIGVSLESSLITKTRKKGLPESCAGVEVTVKIDGTPVAPGTVRFNTRCEKFDALFADIASKCPQDTNGDGIIQASDECTFTDQEISKILDTTSANHFNFIAPDVGTGDHTITVEASVSASGADGIVGATGNSSIVSSVNASSFAAINLGTLSVQVVKTANEHHRHDHGHGDHHGYNDDSIVAE
jgi:hypothetical protein